MVTPVQDNTKLVTINIDGTEYEVPEGGNLVDMAKWFAGNDIPVFCYHPKMEPVGMCRMCVVELGSVSRDRATGDVQLNDDGSPVNIYMLYCEDTVDEKWALRSIEDRDNNRIEFYKFGEYLE